MSLSRVVLTSGRSIELTELRMASTYEGVLEGYPSRFINDRRVRSLKRQAEQAFPSTPVHLVVPVREYPDEAPRAFGPVEVLPAVACFGLFRSEAVAPELDAVMHRSALAVAWFQSGVDVPSGEDAEPALRDLRWEELAQDHEL
jgi:hypothetical protein